MDYVHGLSVTSFISYMFRFICAVLFLFMGEVLTHPSEPDSELYLIPTKWIGQTTVGILNILKNHPSSTFILLTDEDRLTFEDLLSKAKRRKHFQQKIIFVCALMYKDSSDKNHYLVVTDYEIIDLTDRIEYHVKDISQLQAFSARLQQMKQSIEVIVDDDRP